MNAKKFAVSSIFAKDQFIGTDTKYSCADGACVSRTYLDSAASCLMLKPAHFGSLEFMKHYSNTHSETHLSAKIANATYEWSRKQVLEYVGADDGKYSCIFLGSGSTGGFNRIARMLSALRPEKTGVLVSIMEHHSNDLPHRMHHQFWHHVPCENNGYDSGTVDLVALESLLAEHEGQINYVAITAASNVTGIINPVHRVAELAHRYGALVVVDASQYMAHQPFSMSDGSEKSDSVDVVVFSGHKLYAPGSPGVMVIKNELIDASNPTEFGGGMVESVYVTDYTPYENGQAREEAGTPNIIGATLLGITVANLKKAGMKNIAEHENELVSYLFERLLNLKTLRLYGSKDLNRYPRTATVSFNLSGINHELLAKILNDYFAIAVRNGCFCAHPYVRSMIIDELWDADPDLNDAEIEARKGMVRASFGLYNSKEDVDKLASALEAIEKNPDYYLASYTLSEGGRYINEHFKQSPGDYFTPENYVVMESLTT